VALDVCPLTQAARDGLATLADLLSRCDFDAIDLGLELRQELVMRGHGIAFQTRVGLERKLAEGSLVHVPIDAKGTELGPLWSDLGIYTRAGRLLPTGTDNFVQMLKAEIESRQKAEAGRKR
jgi:DNA-binding transcriptional LysR family regulator